MTKSKKVKKKPEGYVFGRPTKYEGEKTIKEIEVYLATCGLIKKDGGVPFYKMPSIVGFAKHIGVATSTVKKWKTEYPNFSAAMERVMQEQHESLVGYSLSKVFDKTVSKLILSSNHGYTERRDTTTNGESVNNAFNITINGDNLESDESTD